MPDQWNASELMCLVKHLNRGPVRFAAVHPPDPGTAPRDRDRNKSPVTHASEPHSRQQNRPAPETDDLSVLTQRVNWKIG
jgi:hypothetical protein